jgi:hypothetical protein
LKVPLSCELCISHHVPVTMMRVGFTRATRGGAKRHAAGTLTGIPQKTVGNGRIGVLPN